ncbi:MAG: ABC transporter permease [Planctomycetota bacterium]|nr:ABC transporter permease [Planctomycetota bacterium]
MWAYILRRALWMVPTFFGILLINFAVLRLQGLSLADQLLDSQRGGDAERRVQAADAAIETHLARFRRTGNDLPALINLRGFLTTEDLLARLAACERRPGYDETARARAEIELWLLGPLVVEPLSAILADERLARWHGPASQALSLAAYRPLLVEDLDRLSVAEQSRLRARNERLKQLRIHHRNTAEHGFVTDDPQAERKRQELLALLREDGSEFARRWRRWTALLLETGFCDFLSKLCTGRLYSETRRAYAFAVIAERWSVTAWLNALAILIAWAVSIPLGVWSARHAGTLGDRAVTVLLFSLWSIPSFFVATLLLHHLCTPTSDGAAWFPNRGLSSPDHLWLSTPAYVLDLAWHAALPLLCLTYGSFTALSRYLRANVLEQLHSDYVRTARAKGLDERAVVWRHAAPNSMITMITLGSGLLAELFGGFVFVEYVFSIPGLGTLMLEAARQHDAPLLMASTVISVLLLLLGILIADILYAVVDPRIRTRYG